MRGLHYQCSPPQGKLIHVITGRIFDVAVDIRPALSSYGHWAGYIVDAVQCDLVRGLSSSPSFFHGFYVLSETADVFYKCTDYYPPEDEAVIRWDSPDLAIQWPLSEQRPLSLSDKDRLAPCFIAVL